MAHGDIMTMLRSDEPLASQAPLARELLEYAARALDPTLLWALCRWMEGAPFDELATELGLAAPHDAEKVVCATVARLCRHFGDPADA